MWISKKKLQALVKETVEKEMKTFIGATEKVLELEFQKIQSVESGFNRIALLQSRQYQAMLKTSSDNTQKICKGLEFIAAKRR